MKKIFIIFFIIFLSNFLYSKTYPVVIIGGGVGGLSCSINLKDVDHLIIDGKNPSSISKSSNIKNWEIEISGKNLIKNLRNQVNGKIVKREAIGVDFSKNPFVIEIQNFQGKKEKIKAMSCVIATGARAKILDIGKMKRFLSKGVFTCVLCDGFLYKNKIVAVIGKGKSAILNALHLSNIAKKVYVIVEEDLRKVSGMDRKVFMKKNIIFLNNSKVESFKKLKDENCEFENYEFEIGIKKYGDLKKILVNGIFLSLGYQPNSEIFKSHLELNKEGYIVLKKGQQTSKEGIFAIGDVVNIEKKATNAKRDGKEAAKEVYDYLKKFN
jgi:thioredoxin reductase (NADPH)